MQFLVFARNPFTRVCQLLSVNNKTLVTAESLTGGLLGAQISSIPGVSKVYWGGMIAYTEAAKITLLGVDPETLATHGAVSQQTAEAMAIGALRVSSADFSIAVTGLAGPGSAEQFIPVGTVWCAIGYRNITGGFSVVSRLFLFSGSRNTIRVKTSFEVAAMIQTHLDRK